MEERFSPALLASEAPITPTEHHLAKLLLFLCRWPIALAVVLISLLTASISGPSFIIITLLISITVIIVTATFAWNRSTYWVYPYHPGSRVTNHLVSSPLLSSGAGDGPFQLWLKSLICSYCSYKLIYGRDDWGIDSNAMEESSRPLLVVSVDHHSASHHLTPTFKEVSGGLTAK